MDPDWNKVHITPKLLRSLSMWQNLLKFVIFALGYPNGFPARPDSEKTDVG